MRYSWEKRGITLVPIFFSSWENIINSLTSIAIFVQPLRHGGGLNEKPFLTELDNLSTHSLVSVFKSRYQQTNLIASDESAAAVPIDPESLKLRRSSFLHDLLHSHLGVISSRFYWHQNEGDDLLSGQFVWCEDPLDAAAFDITQNCLTSLLEVHLHAATAFRRLDWLASRSSSVMLLRGWEDGVCNAGYHGSVWRALMEALSEWLRVYALTLERKVLSESRLIMRHRADSGLLLDLTHRLQPMIKNML